MPASRTARRLLRAFCTCSITAAVLTAGGCWTPGGLAWSFDRFTYESTAYQPQTVTVIDTRNGQPVWSVDIPVGQKLAMDFYEGDGDGTGVMPDTLHWAIWPIGEDWGDPNNQVNMPPSTARRIDVKFRPAPELPPGTPPAPAVAAAPAPTDGAASPAGAAAVPAAPVASGPATPPAPPVPEVKGLPVVPELIAGRYYLVAARLSADDAVKARDYLIANNTPSIVVHKPSGSWVVLTGTNYSDAEFNSNATFETRDASVRALLQMGRKWQQDDKSAPTNFSMAFWEQAGR